MYYIFNKKFQTMFWFLFLLFNFYSKIRYFRYTYRRIQNKYQNTEKIQKFFWTFLEKQKFLDSFAENVVHLGIFGILGIIPKFLVLLNFSIENFWYSIVLKFRYWTFSVFNTIELWYFPVFSVFRDPDPHPSTVPLEKPVV